MSENEIRELLKNSKTIAVIGLSPVPNRPSFGVTRYMISNGYDIYGVRPASPPEILGRPCVEKLADLKTDVDIIDVFRNSDAIPQLVTEIEAWMKSGRKVKALWLQEGVSHPEAEKKAESLGLSVISDRCILKDHARLM
ncbi:MAG: CoA-binding protein [Bdellovibrionota bacterium]